MLVEPRQGGFMFRQFRFQLFDPSTIAQDLVRGELLMERFNPRFAQGNLGFDLCRFAVRESSFAALLGGSSSEFVGAGCRGSGFGPGSIRGNTRTGLAGQALLNEMLVGVVVAVDDTEPHRAVGIAAWLDDQQFRG